MPTPSTVDRLDVDMHDNELRAEIRLVADLIIAANQSEERLPQRDIDALLGLTRLYDTVDGSTALGGFQP